jgi:hypothetical protein
MCLSWNSMAAVGVDIITTRFGWGLNRLHYGASRRPMSTQGPSKVVEMLKRMRVAVRLAPGGIKTILPR